MTRRQLPRKAAAVLDAATFLPGEIAVDLTNDELRYDGDGGTVGGIVVAKKSAVEALDARIDTLELAKIQQIATDRLLGRDTAGTGDVEQLTVGGGIEFTTTGGIQRSALTGDVTATAGSNAMTIANNAVTLAKMATMATDSILGRATASTGNVEVLTALPFAFTGDVTRAADSNAQTIANDAVTYAKMQNVSATDKVLGRSTAGAGDVEEITFTAFARTLADDADAATARSTLGAQASSSILTALAASSGVTGTITVSTSAPSGGSDGDIWLERET